MLNFVKTHYSFEAFNKPEKIIPLLKEQGYDSIAIIDPNLCGAVSFFKSCKENGVKPVIGYTGKEVYLARNKEEYHELLKAFSENREPSCLELVGLPHCEVADMLFEKYYPPVLKEGAYEKILEHIKAKKNKVYLCLTREIFPANIILTDLLTDVGVALKLETVFVPECYYPSSSDAKDHLIQICYRAKCKLSCPTEEEKYKRFFLTDKFDSEYSEEFDYVKDLDQYEVFEDYDILSPPKLPTFKKTNGLSPEDYLREWCRKGWKEKITSKGLDEKLYVARIKEELDIWFEYGLSSYFLILSDIIRWCHENDILVGLCRGSAGGCLTSYLTNLTKIDPIKYGLLRERFFSDARAGSLPDIDLDIEKFKRADVLEYIKSEYGEESVCQLITFSTLSGKSALKAVLRFNESCGFDQMNVLTNLLAEFSKVEDQMQAIDEESLIRFSIKKYPERFAQYVRYENDELVGDFAESFAQAIRIEDTIVDWGKHASAIIVYDGKITNAAPLMMDKAEESLICGFDMGDAEKSGLVKLDLLGLSTLDRIALTLALIEGKKV